MAARSAALSAERILAAEPIVVFVHIPKTAGATVLTMFMGAYSKWGVYKVGNYFRNPEKGVWKVWRVRGAWDRGSMVHEARISAGHTPYGVFREVMPLRTRYMTFLRNPVDRVLSHYYRHLHRQRPSRAGRFKARPGARTRADSLEQALMEMRVPQIRNLATRFLCTHQSPGEELPQAALEEAKANLRGFAFVGIQERFDESAVMMQRTLRMDPVPYLRRHVNRGRPAVKEVSTYERTLVEEHNQLDMELYAFGRQLFEQRVQADGEDLPADVEKLQSASAAAEAEYRARHQHLCDWLDGELPAGTNKPAETIRASAQRSGISPSDLKVARRLMGVKKHQHAGGPSLFTRPAA